ncbi:MAG: 1-deoxy-D-xylulose-5-phosphate reductoisomerase [Pantoea sp. Brub]|nr:1-deoxy-D-xylulose-5-phosphate reductoisomerase [Pantoea sp. Brub]
MKRLTLLGSTGSIGVQTLDIINAHPELYQVIALVAGYNTTLIVEQCKKFHPLYVAMANEKSANIVRQELKYFNIKTKVLSGIQAACELVALNEVDQVMSAIVGMYGLLPTLAAIRSGKTILLANKESLIACGHLIIDEVKKYNATLLPIDSEHNAIFQNLPLYVQKQLGSVDLTDHGIKSIILTGSGGPLYNLNLSDLEKVSPQEACNHPNWSMGPKISVDSATMINKGFEYIESCLLFNINSKLVEIIIHHQSIIHSMVRYHNGTILAHLSPSDMRIPIAYCMSWPNIRINKTNVKSLDFNKLSSLTFETLDFNRYPCLKLAIDAYHSGQAAIATLNAANEIAVEAFLKNQIKFTDIALLNNEILIKNSFSEPDSIESVLEIDRIARVLAMKTIKNFSIA